MDWQPNRDAVEFFVASVLPKLRSSAPNTRFVVAGRSASDNFQAKFARLRHVRFTGPVPDMRAEIAKAAVCVVPLRIGSGTRLKILRRLRWPSPSSPPGLERRDWTLWTARRSSSPDRPEAFARAVADLLADPLRAPDARQRRTPRVERQYSLAALRISVREALTQVAGKKSPRGRSRRSICPVKGFQP